MTHSVFESTETGMEKEISDLLTEFLGHVFEHKSIVVGAIKNVMFRRILLVLVFQILLFFAASAINDFLHEKSSRPVLAEILTGRRKSLLPPTKHESCRAPQKGLFAIAHNVYTSWEGRI